MPTLGFLVNPIAGMGGTVGLKGTDGIRTLNEAARRGAKPVSPQRGKDFLSRLKLEAQDFQLIVGTKKMGGELANAVGLEHESFGRVGKRTTARDTIRISLLMAKRKVDLIVFCGGDGTARDILKGVGSSVPVLGVPAGVKVYSSVFAINPFAAADTAIRFLRGGIPTRKGEVVDIDEKSYRENQLAVKLVGSLTIPDSGFLIQESKMPTGAFESEELESVAKFVKEGMNPKLTYVLGPGTTLEKLGEKLGVRKTLLGVDIVRGDGTVLGLDVDESRLLKQAEKSPMKIIVSPIGGQGFLFGRGNQQISSRVLRKIGTENLIIVSSRTKIDSLNPKRLLVDTGDPVLDKELRGYRRVVTGYMEEMVLKVE